MKAGLELSCKVTVHVEDAELLSQTVIVGARVTGREFKSLAATDVSVLDGGEIANPLAEP
jgi:hypothetical protein